MSNDDPKAVLAIWERIAPFWDDFLKEGNEFQKQLVMPTTTALLAPAPGQLILDCCCGNGNYSRRLAEAGVKVVAFDGARNFIERARSRTPDALPIEYLVIDATDRDAMKAQLHGRKFDSAVCSMALMDLPDIAPLLDVLAEVLHPGAPFVFSVSHPCFNNNRVRMTAELVNEHGRIEQQFGVRVIEYRTEGAMLTSGILNQPEPHFMYHRPVDSLLRIFFERGFVVDGYEEPAFQRDAPSKNAFSWQLRPEIPPVLVVRVRKIR